MDVFRSRLRAEHVAEFESDAAEMLGLAQSMPGFVSCERYVAGDGERVSLHEWRPAEKA
jgi:heme-degrading monooxygenase HmoA